MKLVAVKIKIFLKHLGVVDGELDVSVCVVGSLPSVFFFKCESNEQLLQSLKEFWVSEMFSDLSVFY